MANTRPFRAGVFLLTEAAGPAQGIQGDLKHQKLYTASLASRWRNILRMSDDLREPTGLLLLI